MLALDNLKGTNDYNLLAKIYSDIGEICFVQNEVDDALAKFTLSEDYLIKAGAVLDALYKKIDIGNAYRSMKEYGKAYIYFRDVLIESKDSILSGIAYQEIGTNFFLETKYDSAVFFLKESLNYPAREFNRAIRLYCLSEVYYELVQLDSALYFANRSLEYPANFYTKRECYRILANSSYLKGDYKTMAGYMTFYQAMSDSVRKIDVQTKSTIIENIHHSVDKVNKSKRSMWVALSFLPLLFFIGIFIYVRLRNRSKGAEVELEHKKEKLVEYEQKLYSNHEQLKDNLLFKIEEVRKREKAKNKRLSLYEKQEFDLKVFDECLYVNDSVAFDKLMNLTFNNILVKLHRLNPELSRNELVCCCLLLLDLNSQEIILILNVELNTLYKLKQRIAQKLNLNSSTEILPFLKKTALN